MPKGTPPWNVCVVSLLNDYVGLKNALLYADHVEWVSMEPILAGIRLLAMVAGKMGAIKEGLDFGPLQTTTKYSPSLKISLVNRKTQESADFDYALEYPIEYSIVLQHIEENGPNSIVTEHFADALFNQRWEPTSLDQMKESLISLAGKTVANVSKDCKGFILPDGLGHVYTCDWNSYLATSALQSAVARLLLPDVSSLPFPAIFEMRDQLSDVLEPMRAELLRMSIELRKFVRNINEEAAVKAEAEILIATRVEPIVREADHRARELANKKWRKLYTSAAKTFGFAGAAYFDPKLLGTAVQQTLETGALAFGDLEDRMPGPKMTAQFVLRTRTMISEIG